MGIAIRHATMADADRMAHLVSELGYRTSAVQMRRRLEAILRDEDYTTLVACEGELIVGFIGARLGPVYESDDPYGQIMALAVATDRHRRGVGRALIEAAESLLVARAARIVVVMTGNHRNAAHAFYEKLGYTFTGRRYSRVIPPLR